MYCTRRTNSSSCSPREFQSAPFKSFHTPPPPLTGHPRGTNEGNTVSHPEKCSMLVRSSGLQDMSPLPDFHRRFVLGDGMYSPQQHAPTSTMCRRMALFHLTPSFFRQEGIAFWRCCSTTLHWSSWVCRTTTCLRIQQQLCTNDVCVLTEVWLASHILCMWVLPAARGWRDGSLLPRDGMLNVPCL